MPLNDWEKNELHSAWLWMKGALAAVLGGLATTISGTFAAPDTFNFTDEGLHKIWKLALGGAVLALCAYFKQSPLPSAKYKAAVLKLHALGKSDILQNYNPESH